MTLHPEAAHFAVGRFSCLAIRDGVGRYPIAMFLTNVARERYEPLLRQRGQDLESVDLPYSCFVIETGSALILVDTGIGVERGGGQLIPLLQREGIDPRAIGTVILSHGHGDHVGGNLDADGKPAFPNARYVTFRTEWDFWMSGPALDEWRTDERMKKTALAFIERNLRGIQAQTTLLEPGMEIVPGITAIPAFGHSPGHMALDISCDGHRLLFMGDAIVLPLHFEFPDAIGLTDHRPAEVIQTRITLLEKAAGEGCLVCASHLPFPGLGHVKARDAGWEWHPVRLPEVAGGEFHRAGLQA